ncbi:MAG: alpha/beta fold hydrolase [Deltaproteobacteria bacterium]|nr:alpha/beta fold hydrolase [Deltaproteobacteria bacterium]
MGNSTESGRGDWTFDGTWPYEPRYFDTGAGRMHYVDEGPRDGRPVVLVHGNPTWGYLYRHFITPLADAGYRVVVPDHLGFGRSDKPNKATLYTIPKHSERLIALMDSLGLQDATVVAQDCPPPGTKVPAILRFIRAPLVGEFMIKGRHAFVKQLLFRAIRRDRLNAQSRAAYLAPHPTYATRTGLLVFPRQIPDSPTGPVSDFLGDVHEGLKAFRDRPVAFAWGKKDPVFPPSVYKRLWQPDFPEAPILWLDKAGHFLQEDAPELIVPNLLEFLER